MNEDDLVLLGAAGVAGYFIFKGAFKIPDIVGNIADVFSANTYNAAAALPNIAGITNTEKTVNEWGAGTTVLTTTQTSGFSAAPQSVFSSVATGINTPGGLLGAGSLTDLGYQFNQIIGWF